jgi:hypothetical protein
MRRATLTFVNLIPDFMIGNTCGLSGNRILMAKNARFGRFNRIRKKALKQHFFRFPETFDLTSFRFRK